MTPRDYATYSLMMVGGDPRDILTDLARPSWQRHGTCNGAAHTEGPQFHTAQGESTQPAKAMCARCPVQVECLTYALEDPSLVGVWGGTSPAERDRLRRQQQAA